MSVLAANEADDFVVVLIVEDENFIRLDIASYLEDAGYAVIEVGNGEAAIALCNPGTSIDMVITGRPVLMVVGSYPYRQRLCSSPKG